MINLSYFSDLTKVLINLGIIFTVGCSGFLVIKWQLNKNLKETIGVYQSELDIFREKVGRLENDMKVLQGKYEESKLAFDELKKKKNYLKQILIEALQNRKDIQEILTKSLQ